jgi:hypothetical protein
MRTFFFGLTAGLLALVGLAGSPRIASAAPRHGHAYVQRAWHHDAWRHPHYVYPAYRPYYGGTYYVPAPAYYAAPVVPSVCYPAPRP